MQEIYVIRDPEGNDTPHYGKSSDGAWRAFANTVAFTMSAADYFIKRRKEEGYTCCPLNLYNPETHNLVPIEDTTNE